MSERGYLAIINIHGKLETVKAPDLKDLKEKVDDILVVPKFSYPNFDFDSKVEVLRINTLRKKQKRRYQNIK